MGPGSEALQGRPECLLNTHETLRSLWGFWSARATRKPCSGPRVAELGSTGWSGRGGVTVGRWPRSPRNAANGNRNSFSESLSLPRSGPLGLLGLSQPWAADVFT